MMKQKTTLTTALLVALMTPVAFAQDPATPAESATPRAAAVERYEVTSRSTSGRLIDLLM